MSTTTKMPSHIYKQYEVASPYWKVKIDEALAAEVPIITHAKQADELFHSQCMRKDARAFAMEAPNKEVEESGYRAYKVTCLVLSGESSVSCLQTPVNRFSPYMEQFIEPFLGRTATGGALLHERHTKALLKVRVEDPDAVGYFLDSPIYRKEVVDEEGVVNEHFYALNPCDDGTVIELITGNVELRTAVIGMDGSPLPGVLAYGSKEGGLGCATSSNGEVKRGVITLPCNNLPGFNWSKIIDEVNFGLGTLLTKEQFVATKAKDFAQMSTRWAQSMAPAVEGRVALEAEAYFMGILADTRDGQVDITDDYVARWMNDRLDGRFLVLPCATRGMVVQCRPHTTKGAATVRSAGYINYLVKRLGVEVVYLYRDEITEKEQHQFDLTVHGKGKKDSGAYAGKLVVILPTRGMEDAQIEFVADLNGLKTFFNLRTVTYLNALSAAEVVDGVDDEITTSIQTAGTFFACDYITAREIYDELNGEEIAKATEALMSDEGKAPTFDSFSVATNWSQVAAQVAPAFARNNYRPLYKQAVNKRLEGLVNKAARLNLKTDGTFSMFIPDAGADFGVVLLKDDGDVTEAFWPAAEALGIREAVLARFPKAHVHAVSLIKFVYSSELVERAESMYMGAEELMLLKQFIYSLHDGVLMCPAAKSFMDRHDGADFDGDHGQLTTESRLVALVKDAAFEGCKSNAMTVHIRKNEEYISELVECEDAGLLSDGFVDDLLADLACVTDADEDYKLLAELIENNRGAAKKEA